MTFEELVDPGNYESIDIKLANAVVKITKGAAILKDNVTFGARMADARNKGLTCRQMLYLINAHFKLPTLMAAHATLDDLGKSNIIAQMEAADTY